MPTGSEPDVWHADASVGRVLGRYVLGSYLGRGAFGSVYEAMDRDWNQVVALKLLGSVGATPATRLADEFRELADVSHPNVVAMYALDVVDADCMIAMELVLGTDLDRAGLPRRPDALRRVVGGILDGLDHLHDRGILHLDLKPSNIRVRPDGTPVLVDFGLAQRFVVATGSTTPEGIRGTPGFMAPEQLWGQPVSPATDFYCLGMLLHRLTADHPKLGPTGDAPLPNAADRSWTAVINGLTAKDPEQRWSSSEVREALGLDRARRVLTFGRSGLVGRSRELAELERFLRVGTEGGPTVMLIDGSSGVGKTRLIESVVERITTGLTILQSRCYENDHTAYTAIEPLAQFAATVSTPTERAALSALFPFVIEGGASRAPVTNADASAAFRSAVHRACNPQPAALVVDDAHWASPDSMVFLARLIAPPDPPALRIVLALSSNEAAACISMLEDELARLGAGTPHRLSLPTLDPSATRELLRSIVRADGDARDLDTLAAWCEGSPFLAHAIAAYESAAPDPGACVRHLVDAALEDLPPGSRELLCAIALSSRPPSRSTVIAATGAFGNARHVFHALQARRIVVSDGPHIDATTRLYHRKLLAEIVGSLPQSEARGIHGKLADVLLTGSPVEHDRVALHLHAAGRSELASLHAERAGDGERSRFAFVEAAGWYERAAAWIDDRERIGELTRKRAHALLDGGRTIDAAGVFAAAAGMAEGPTRAALRRLAGHAALTGGAVEEGVAQLSEVLSHLGVSRRSGNFSTGLALAGGIARLAWRRLDPAPREPSVEDRLRIDAFWSLGQGLANVRPLEAVAWVLRSVDEALRRGHTSAAARGLALLGGSLAAFGRLGEHISRRCLDGAARIAASSGEDAIAAVLPIMNAHVHALRGDWARTASDAAAGLERLGSGTPGMHWERTLGHCMWLFAKDQIGDMQAVRTGGRELLEEGRERGDRYAQAVGAQFEAFGRLSVGDVAGAREQANWVVSRWAEHGYTTQHFYSMRVNRYADLLERRSRIAREAFEEELPRLAAERYEAISTGRFQIGELHARILLAAARDDRSLDESTARRVEQRARMLAHERRSDGPPHAAWMRGAVASIRGDEETAASLLAQAVTGFRNAGMRLLELACARQASRLARRTDPEIDTQLRALGVTELERWTDALVPGIWSSQ